MAEKRIEDPTVTTFGFYQLSQIKRPFSVFSNRSTRLNSEIDLNIEYVDRKELNESPRKLLTETYKANEAKTKAQRRVKQQNVEKNKKSESSLGFHHVPPGSCNDEIQNSKYMIVNKLLASREAFPDKLITKEGCKNYLTELRMKQENEKQHVIDLGNGMKGENKHKFEFFLKHHDKEILRPSSTTAQKTNKSSPVIVREAFEDTTNKPVSRGQTSNKSEKSSTSKALSCRDALPKLLNSIRMTNFSVTHNEKKRPLKELQQQRASQKFAKVLDEADENRGNVSPVRYRKPNLKENSSLLLSISESSETGVEDEIQIELDKNVANQDLKEPELTDRQLTEITRSTLSVSTLNSQQKIQYKTKWPTVEEIEKLLGIKIRPPEPPKVIEVVKEEEPPVVDSAKTKGKKSAIKKKDTKTDKSPSSAKKRAQIKSTSTINETNEAKKVEATQSAEKPVSAEKTTLSEANKTQVPNEVTDSQVPKQETALPDDVNKLNEIQVGLLPVIEDELPTPLCPSSLRFSKKLGVRLWIENSNFDSSLKTTPLI